MSAAKSNIFQFKQFAVDQTGCAMKVNTDGVLLGALVTPTDPHSILDIGTGTGVITLMLAQRFPGAFVDAVEIDDIAACMAATNFNNSSFKDRCSCYLNSFENYFVVYPDRRYDLIVSNPPFFINSLKSAGRTKELARHTTLGFFHDLVSLAGGALTPNGRLSLILPVETADAVKVIAAANDLYLHQEISVASFADSKPHRRVITFAKHSGDLSSNHVVIYSKPSTYTDQYASVLKDFLTIF